MVLSEAITCGREKASPAGDYCQLIVDGELMMSDTRLEHDTNQTVVLEGHWRRPGSGARHRTHPCAYPGQGLCEERYGGRAPPRRN